jgi:hypothetical protein
MFAEQPGAMPRSQSYQVCREWRATKKNGATLAVTRSGLTSGRGRVIAWRSVEHLASGIYATKAMCREFPRPPV